MSFLKRKGKTLFVVLFCFFILVQQLAVRYRLTHSSEYVTTDPKGNDVIAFYEINQLEQLWRNTGVDDLITPAKMANPFQLESARARLFQAQKGIDESESRVSGLKGKRNEFFQKVHAYYRHSAISLINIIDFLLAKQGQYTVQGNEINFEDNSHAETFKQLIETINSINQEKADLDKFISIHNRDIGQKKLK